MEPDPAPLVRGTNPRIHNSAVKLLRFVLLSFLLSFFSVIFGGSGKIATKDRNRPFHARRMNLYNYLHLSWITWIREPLFLNVYGAQESIPRNEFRQPM